MNDKELEKWFIDNVAAPIEEEEYQARLDKVLSKFEYVIANTRRTKQYIQLNHSRIIIEYYNGKFELNDWYDSGEIEISLKTVESILEDIENE